MRWMAVPMLCLVLTSCSSAPDAAPITTAELPAPSTQVPTPPAPESTTRDCDSAARADIEETIRAQVAAFAQADFAAARMFASKGFQSSVSDREFQTIIEAQYAFLLDSPQVDFLDCAQVDDLAQILVQVTASDIVDLQYRLVRERDGWRIDGATIADVREAVAA